MLNRVRRFFGLEHRQPRTIVGETASGLAVIAGIPDIDYLDKLGFPEYLHEFKRLANDPQIAKELRNNTLPIIGADWIIEPASDDPRDMQIAEFVDANILNGGGETFGRDFWQEVSWTARLRDILRFLQNGHSVFQRLLETRGRFTVFRKIKYLTSESIAEWHFDDRDNLDHLSRSYIDSTGKNIVLQDIDAAELVIYTWDQEGSNIIGKPLIRPMWKPFTMKEILEKLEIIDKQKTAVGIPFFKLQPNALPEDEIRARDLTKSMRIGKFEKIFAVIKDGQDFGWKEGGTQTKGLQEIISKKDIEISKAGGSQMSELQTGDLQGGAGVAQAKGLFEAMLHTAVALTIMEQEQRNINLIVDLNYPGTEEYPALKVSRVDPFEQTRNIPAFVSAISAGAVTADLDTENEIRTRYGFMERAEGSTPPPGPTREFRFGKNGNRRRNRGAPERRHVDTERIRNRLDQFEREYLETANAVLTDMRDSVVDRIRAGDLEPEKPDQVKVPFQKELRDRLLAILRGVRDFGRAEVKAETARALKTAGKHHRLQTDPTSRGGAISFANEQNEILVELDLVNLSQRLQAQVAAEFRRLAAQGLTKKQIADGIDDFFEGVSDRQIRDMARTSTGTTFNLGRNVAVQELKDELEPEAVRTEVLDKNTCAPCDELHGKRVKINSKAYLKFQPPAFCDGKERCRGFYIVFPKQ